jgi:hypothetical protein
MGLDNSGRQQQQHDDEHEYNDDYCRSLDRNAHPLDTAFAFSRPLSPIEKVHIHLY